ncbi:hypothetical protein L484_010841 [Morus notabilis]|uniref:Uncharacterized protein n=1 Tax=Morus notabilis TaxID=981085 RepID=W9T075_9ROSA|nr:hypothetical protein L484_010841 [Morus notabilis]
MNFSSFVDDRRRCRRLPSQLRQQPIEATSHSSDDGFSSARESERRRSLTRFAMEEADCRSDGARVMTIDGDGGS